MTPIDGQVGMTTALGATATALGLRLGLDLVGAVILVRLVHYRRYRRAELFLPFFALNLVVFLVTAMLSRVDMTLGSAFGLFAVFSLLRYRTEGINARDMTYLFLLIGLGLVMAVAPASPLVLAGLATSLVGGTALLEGAWLGGRERTCPIVYDNAALVHTSQRTALIDDLRARTGLDVHHVEVDDVDFVRDAAHLTVFFRGA